MAAALSRQAPAEHWAGDSSAQQYIRQERQAKLSQVVRRGPQLSRVLRTTSLHVYLLAVCERVCRIYNDSVLGIDPAKDLHPGAEITADDHRLEMHLLIRADHRTARSLRAEQKSIHRDRNTDRLHRHCEVDLRIRTR